MDITFKMIIIKVNKHIIGNIFLLDDNIKNLYYEHIYYFLNRYSPL